MSKLRIVTYGKYLHQGILLHTYYILGQHIVEMVTILCVKVAAEFVRKREFVIVRITLMVCEWLQIVDKGSFEA